VVDGELALDVLTWAAGPAWVADCEPHPARRAATPSPQTKAVGRLRLGVLIGGPWVGGGRCDHLHENTDRARCG
jgi:hypothetical protein